MADSVCSAEFSMALQTEIFLTETLEFLIQIFFSSQSIQCVYINMFSEGISSGIKECIKEMK